MFRLGLLVVFVYSVVFPHRHFLVRTLLSKGIQEKYNQ